MSRILTLVLIFGINVAMAQQSNLQDYKNSYLVSFKAKGMIKEYQMLKEHDLVDKRKYPSPDISTWYKNAPEASNPPKPMR